MLWDYSALVRTKKCGRVTVTGDGSVGVRANGTSVGYAGLATCGSVWACPVCNAKVQSVRRLEVGVAIANVHANGGSVAFGAITVRHQRGDRLTPLLDVLAYGQARIARDKGVASIRAELGYLGRISALETTIGANGWHPHRHPLALFSRPVSERELWHLHAAEFRAFARGVIAKGYESPHEDGQSFAIVTPGTDAALGEYFAKSQYSVDGGAFEMTGAQFKRGKRGSRTPWQLLESVRLTGDADDLVLWNEYERATKGKRALTYSRGLRDLLGLGKEATDEDVAAEEVGDVEDTGFRVADWSPVVRNPLLGAGLLNAVGPGGNWGAGRGFAAAHGISIRENDE